MQLRLLLAFLIFIPMLTFGQGGETKTSSESDQIEKKEEKKEKEEKTDKKAKSSDDEVLTFQKVKLYDDDFEKLLFRFFINLFFAIILVRTLYYPATKRKDYLFSFMITNIVVFFIIFAMKKYEIDTGIGLGLFAIFGIIRFRTSTMPVREMTYLFMVIGLSVINSLTSKQFSWTEIAFANLVIVGSTFVIEKLWLLEHEAKLNVTYEKIDLIQPGRMEELLADLSARTGLVINRIEIGKINFLNDTVAISIYYYKDHQTSPIYQDEATEIEGY